MLWQNRLSHVRINLMLSLPNFKFVPRSEVSLIKLGENTEKIGFKRMKEWTHLSLSAHEYSEVKRKQSLWLYDSSFFIFWTRSNALCIHFPPPPPLRLSGFTWSNVQYTQMLTLQPECMKCATDFALFVHDIYSTVSTLRAKPFEWGLYSFAGRFGREAARELVQT